MRLSMAKRIYLIVAILLVVAAVILIIGLYSVGRLTNSMNDLIRQSKRITNMDNVDKVALNRRIVTVDILGTTDEEEMRKLIDTNMKNLERQMEEQLQSYASNFDEPPTATQREFEKNVHSLWADYVSVTNEVAALSLQNTNAKATRLNNGMFGFWDGVDKEMAGLIDAISADEKAAGQFLRPAWELRGMLTRYRVLMQLYIPEREEAPAAAYLGEIRGIVEHANATLEAMSRELPRNSGGDLAGRLVEKLKTQAAPTIAEIIRLGEMDTNNEAATLLATRGVTARTKLTDYTDMIVATGGKFMNEAIVSAQTLSRGVYVTMIAAGVIGIVLASIFAYITVTGITRGLNRIIGSLDDSSSQVSAAASQISSTSQSLAEGATEQAASLLSCQC